MPTDDQLAEYARIFLSQYHSELTTAPAPAVCYAGISPAAGELLLSVDSGGVPAFVTQNLRQIAQENGIEVTDQTTPNQIVEILRRMAQDAAGTPAPGT